MARIKHKNIKVHVQGTHKYENVKSHNFIIQPQRSHYTAVHKAEEGVEGTGRQRVGQEECMHYLRQPPTYAPVEGTTVTPNFLDYFLSGYYILPPLYGRTNTAMHENEPAHAPSHPDAPSLPDNAR